MALLRKSSLGPGNKDICGKESRALPNGGTVDVEMFFHRDNARSHCKRRSPCAETPSVPVTQPLKPLAICQCCEINKMARGGRNGCQLLPMGCHCSPIDRLSVSATPHFVSPPSEIIRHNATEGGLLDGTCRSNRWPSSFTTENSKEKLPIPSAPLLLLMMD